MTSSYKPVYLLPVTTERAAAARLTPTTALTLKGDSPVNAPSIVPQSDAAATVSRWLAGNPTGDEFTLADFAALHDAARTDPRIDADEVTAIAYALFGGAIYYAAPWSCPTCHGARTVAMPHPATAHLHAHDTRRMDDIDDDCPTCCDGYAAEYAGVRSAWAA